jgi:putative inorganic carbon (hco3(-)) transporter
MMRVSETGAPNTLIGWPILVVIAVGVGLSLLITSAPSLLAVGGVFAAIFLFLFLERPALGLLILLVARACTDLALVFGVQTIRGTAGALLSPNAGFVLVLILAGGLYILSRRVPLLSLPGGLFFAVVLLAGLVGIVRSHQLLLGFNEWLPLVASFVVYALVARLFKNPGAIQRLIDVLAVSFILPCLFGFFELATGRSIVYVKEPFLRITGTFVHPNPFGLYLVLIISVFLCQSFDQQGTRKLTALAITACAGILLIATFARFAWVGVLVVLLVVGALRYRMLLFFAPAIVVVALLLPPVTSRLADVQGGSFADRQQIWQTLLAEWQGATGADYNPAIVTLNRLAGLGPGATIVLSAQAYGQSIAPHDDYIRLLIEYGYVGLAAYLALLFVLIRHAYRVLRRNLTPALSAAALSFLAVAVAYPVMSLTDQVLTHTQDQIYFWALAGMTVAIGRMPREAAAAEEEEEESPIERPVAGMRATAVGSRH